MQKQTAEDQIKHLENELWEITTIAERVQEELDAEHRRLHTEFTAARTEYTEAAVVSAQRTKALEEILANVREQLSKSQDEARRSQLELLEAQSSLAKIEALNLDLMATRDAWVNSQEEAAVTKTNLVKAHEEARHAEQELMQARAVVEKLEAMHLELMAKQQADSNSAADPK